MGIFAQTFLIALTSIYLIFAKGLFWSDLDEKTDMHLIFIIVISNIWILYVVGGGLSGQSHEELTVGANFMCWEVSKGRA